MLLSLESRLLSVPSSFPARGPCERSVKVRDASAGRGRRSCANGNWGSPGTWELLSSPRKTTRMGIPGDQPQARRSALGGGGRDAGAPGATVVPPSEGNEVRREGRQEVAVPW
jgi:hypothetical protein